MALGFLLAKEFKQFIRTPIFIGLTLVFPAAIMLVIPWIVSMDIKNISVMERGLCGFHRCDRGLGLFHNGGVCRRL